MSASPERTRADSEQDQSVADLELNHSNKMSGIQCLRLEPSPQALTPPRRSSWATQWKHNEERGGSVGRAELGYLNVRKDFGGRLVNTIDVDPARAR
ncbi:hypothetical protein GON06_14130 [Microbacterium sp. MAH-37]|nr:hypothetical protein [Microbacterium sp. MAH-37]